jgi:hypothetical protein
VTSISLDRRAEHRQREETIVKLWEQGFTARQIERITGVNYNWIHRHVTRGRKRPDPTPSMFSLLPEEIKRDLNRALRDFEMSQTPANWAKLQDARRRYEDCEAERKRQLLHR